MPNLPSNGILRIFLVDDHADTLKYFCLFLESLGHQVAHATSMKQALAEIPSTNCDVLISDIALPDGDGWQLLTQLRESNLPYPSYAVVTSGIGAPADRAKSLAAGFRHHILKPFDPRNLIKILKEAADELESKTPCDPRPT